MNKSSILAPFNSNETEEDFIGEVQPLIESRKIIKFSSKLREINRQYERDNNSNIDNGVYVQQMSPRSSLKSYSTRSTAYSTQHYTTQVNKQVLNKMEKMGLDKGFVISSLNANAHNSATTCYYLLCEQ